MTNPYIESVFQTEDCFESTSKVFASFQTASTALQASRATFDHRNLMSACESCRRPRRLNVIRVVQAAIDDAVQRDIALRVSRSHHIHKYI